MLQSSLRSPPTQDRGMLFERCFFSIAVTKKDLPWLKKSGFLPIARKERYLCVRPVSVKGKPMLARPSLNTPSTSDLNASFEASSEQRVRHSQRNARATDAPGPRRIRSNPLLNIPIGRRLALGFLLPALIAALTLSSVGVQSQQRLLQESLFYQNLFDAYTSLSAGGNVLEQVHTDVQQTVTYAVQPHPLPAILSEDET